MARALLVPLLLACLAGPAAGLPSRPEGEPADGDAGVARALELRRKLGELSRELEELLEELTPEQRQEVERRWRPKQGAETVGPTAATSAPAPVTEAIGGAPVQAPDGVTPVAGERPAQPERGARRCGTLDVLDSDGDGAVSGADRNWRYLSLWKDDGDGTVEASELRSLFEHGIRRVSARLYSYTTAREADGGVWVEDAIYFDLPGRRARAALAIDAGGLARGRELWLEDASGARLDGFQVLREGLAWVASDGERTSVLCDAV